MAAEKRNPGAMAVARGVRDFAKAFPAGDPETTRNPAPGEAVSVVERDGVVRRATGIEWRLATRVGRGPWREGGR
ncbi:MAG: hypothetical protein VYD87_13715 [Pseudomonadota bacterium]|nr:hypothetical protein [Pseudomonadota bacterium]MEE3100989.1 hypothetical protein [Pseudomonadota bacterium]